MTDIDVTLAAEGTDRYMCNNITQANIAPSQLRSEPIMQIINSVGSAVRKYIQLDIPYSIAWYQTKAAVLVRKPSGPLRPLQQTTRKPNDRRSRTATPHAPGPKEGLPYSVLNDIQNRCI